MTVTRLRLNQGDRSEGRTYYCMHFVAAELGFFAAEGIEVAFTWAESAGGTTRGGQVPAVIDGTADLAIAGPMVLMRMAEDGDPPLRAFCAAVAGNPWVLAAAAPWPGFQLSDLAGAAVCDIAGIGTATLTFQWLLRRYGVDDVWVLPGSGDDAADIDAVASGRVAFALHSLHALAPALAQRRLALVRDLAGPTGPVPWSAYVARPQTLRARPALYAGFRRAIGRALAWIAMHPAAEIAAVVAPHYPAMSAASLRTAIGGHQAFGVFATTPHIPRDAHDHFARILAASGWLKQPATYDRVVAVP